MAKISDKRVVAERHDLEMLERPHLWPQGNLIFIKRIRNGNQETGPCVIDEGRYIVRRHQWMGNKQVFVDTIIYRDLQMIIDDGWVVD